MLDEEELDRLGIRGPRPKKQDPRPKKQDPRPTQKPLPVWKPEHEGQEPPF